MTNARYAHGGISPPSSLPASVLPPPKSQPPSAAVGPATNASRKAPQSTPAAASPSPPSRGGPANQQQPPKKNAVVQNRNPEEVAADIKTFECKNKIREDVLHKKCIDPNNKEVCSVVKDCGVIDGIKTLGSENWKLGNPGDWESIKGHYYSDKLTQPAHKQAFRKTLGCVAGSLYRNYPEYGECNKFIEPFRKPQPGTSLANRPSSQVAKKPNSNSNSNSNAPKSQVAKKPNSNASGAPGKSQVAKKPNSNAGKKTQDPAPPKVHSTLTVKERQNLLEAKKNTGKSFGF